MGCKKIFFFFSSGVKSRRNGGATSCCQKKWRVTWFTQLWCFSGLDGKIYTASTFVHVWHSKNCEKWVFMAKANKVTFLSI